jgi:hypothetical protein
MVLTKPELIGLLQNEIRILLHLITKIEPNAVSYRPTEKQRSTIEWLRYLAVMGPVLVKSAKEGGFNQTDWVTRSEALKEADLATVTAAIAKLPDEYAALLADVPDEFFRKDIEMFGRKSSIGVFFVATILGGYAAYRTQIFNYLKACGRTELNTMNLWAGIDPPPAK